MHRCAVLHCTYTISVQAMLPVIIPHTKHASSLAAAAVATLAFLPDDSSRRFMRSFRRLRHLSAYAMTSGSWPLWRCTGLFDLLNGLARFMPLAASTRSVRTRALPVLVISVYR